MLKVELIQGQIYNTRQEPKMAVFDTLKYFTTGNTANSHLGYLSPIDFEKKNAA